MHVLWCQRYVWLGNKKSGCKCGGDTVFLCNSVIHVILCRSGPSSKRKHFSLIGLFSIGSAPFCHSPQVSRGCSPASFQLTTLFPSLPLLTQLEDCLHFLLERFVNPTTTPSPTLQPTPLLCRSGRGQLQPPLPTR